MMPTATRIASLSNLRQQEKIGNANNQSPLWDAVAAKKEARRQVEDRLLSTWERTQSTPVLS